MSNGVRVLLPFADSSPWPKGHRADEYHSAKLQTPGTISRSHTQLDSLSNTRSETRLGPVLKVSSPEPGHVQESWSAADSCPIRRRSLLLASCSKQQCQQHGSGSRLTRGSRLVPDQMSQFGREQTDPELFDGPCSNWHLLSPHQGLLEDKNEHKPIACVGSWMNYSSTLR